MARQPAPDTRDRILDTAARLFTAHGVRAVGMQRIVDECGCGKNLLYREFPSKDDLVLAHLAGLRATWLAQVEEVTAPLADDPAAQLVAIAELAALQVREPDYRGCAFRNCFTEFPDHRVGGFAADHLADVRGHIADLAARTGAARPDLLADRIWLVIEGMYASAAHPGGERADEVAVALVAELTGVVPPAGRVART
ncbi:TetR/AcrR family transcriptional regulator [Saccharothrix luteola]|uniref:TetR/AcrR family transcriptional regulator n=1 Tax=Saccharothrix luteola TaxID=2893018 RepID=UPI001E5B093E|nr:TetR/AcrR family transcriptional regulator [Saccharothrix luteola]MCC8246478.1 TetR/AcrR family transcriptional regulator [Saccharothrix luteola]